MIAAFSGDRESLEGGEGIMHHLLGSAGLLLITCSNVTSYVLAGGAIEIRVGRFSIKLSRPERKD